MYDSLKNEVFSVVPPKRCNSSPINAISCLDRSRGEVALNISSLNEASLLREKEGIFAIAAEMPIQKKSKQFPSAQIR